VFNMNIILSFTNEETEFLMNLADRSKGKNLIDYISFLRRDIKSVYLHSNGWKHENK
jgi:hypothetical protein